MKPANDLVSIFKQAVHAVDPAELLARQVKNEGRSLVVETGETRVEEDLSKYRRIIVLGMGKASARMAFAMEAVLGDGLADGFVITKYGHGASLEKVRIMEAGHPVPDENSLKGARILTGMASQAEGDTLIINLVSGGGSSLLALGAEGIGLADKVRTTEVLLSAGADIDEINCIRKHISGVKGGWLARTAHPARLISLILSDVVGDRLDTIASGITAPDPTTFKEALLVLEKYSLLDKVPTAVREHLFSGDRGLVPETPKPGDPVFRRVTNIIIGSNGLACRSALAGAQRLGYHASILTSTMTGEARQAGECLAGLAMEMQTGRSCLARPHLLILGGETTVTIHGKGKGGRNQEMALAFACSLHRACPGSSGIYFLPAGTDGTDGPTDAAGAMVIPALMEKMKDISAEAERHLDDNDAYTFFDRHGLLLKTGPTCTNVCDLVLLLVA